MKLKNLYANSWLRLQEAAAEAFPPLYLLVKSSFTLSKKEIRICLPTESTATTQYAAISRHTKLTRAPTKKTKDEFPSEERKMMKIHANVIGEDTEG